MGRRPNPLVVEFFERGAKLEDRTNRYEHRCKNCGELVSTRGVSAKYITQRL